MKAFVTSIGESTTDLCKWALERNGFSVIVIEDKRLLVEKLHDIYTLADADFVRVDADVVVNKRFTPEYVRSLNASPDYWWTQTQTFDWFKQGATYGGVQIIKNEAIPHLLKHVHEFRHSDRPETQLSRIDELHHPRRFTSIDTIVGLHGYAQIDVERVIKQKKEREYFDSYDFELAEKLEELLP